MDKNDVGEILEEIGVLLELKGENPFKTRAYANAARTLEGLTEPLETVVQENRLGVLKGFGEAMRKKVTELVTTGRLKYYDDLRASIPEGLVQMLDLPGLGPKKIKLLNDKLGLETIDELEAACKEGKISALSGFGAKSEAKIREGIDFRRRYASHHRISEAIVVAEPMLDRIRKHPDVIRCSTAGSLRRHKEIIRDVDFLVSSKKPEAVIDFFTSFPEVLTINAKGETKGSVILEGGIQADLRVVTDKEFPFALAYFTGSKEHNIVMRQRAIDKGLRLNEYGLYKSKQETRDPKRLVDCRSEEEIFEALDLAYVPPELREDKGEFEAAEKGEIPQLLEWTELKGSLHNHSTWSDGRESLEEIEEFATELGLDYWAITDHSRSEFQANGLDSKRLRQQIKEVKKVNRKLEKEGTKFRLLTGSEVDILSEGKLDFDDDLLADLDVVVASLHQGFSSDESLMTKRLIKAAENPYVHMLGHLTGRLLLEREAYPVNHQAVIDACAETGTWIEINASPYRFDMDWRWWPYARSKGVKCVINCDAHRKDHAAYLKLGAGIARKGWLTKKDVVNTLPVEKLRKQLALKRS